MSSYASPLRRALAALGLLLALAILLQPICGAYEGAHEQDSSAACCLEMPQDALVATPTVAPDKALAPTFAVASSIPRVAIMPAAPSIRLAARNDPPPPPLSYHARSARIQR